jgi:hypothetical protein
LLYEKEEMKAQRHQWEEFEAKRKFRRRRQDDEEELQQRKQAGDAGAITTG